MYINKYDWSGQCAERGMRAEDTFKICLIEHDYDLVGTVPTSPNLYTGLYFKDSTDPPYIEYAVSDSIFFGTNF